MESFESATEYKAVLVPEPACQLRGEDSFRPKTFQSPGIYDPSTICTRNPPLRTWEQWLICPFTTYEADSSSIRAPDCQTSIHKSLGHFDRFPASQRQQEDSTGRNARV